MVTSSCYNSGLEYGNGMQQEPKNSIMYVNLSKLMYEFIKYAANLFKLHGIHGVCTTQSARYLEVALR